MKLVLFMSLMLIAPLVAQTRVSQQNLAEQFLLAAANQVRAAHGLGPVARRDDLALAARQHAYQMVQHGQISHQFDGEQDLAARAGATGTHFSLITENVAEAPDASKINDLWMASAGHRANLLDAKVDSVGIAVIRSRGEYYAVEDFARTVEQLTLAQQEKQVVGLIADSGLKVLPTTAAARQTCTMKQGFAGSLQPWFVMRYTTSNLSRLPSELAGKLRTGKYHQALVGACVTGTHGAFTAYSLAVMLYP